MKKKILYSSLAIILLLVFTSIGYFLSKITINSQSIPITSKSIDTKKSIYFEVNNFEIKYERNTLTSSSYEETYSGEGYIMAKGDPSKISKPYFVILNIVRVKGGNTSSNNDNYNATVLVKNGSGKFNTSDNKFYYQGSDDNARMVKPEYQLKIIGYVPISEQ